MLTPHEESVFKEWVKNHTPLQRPQTQVKQVERSVESVTRWVDQMFARCGGKMKTQNINEDNEVESRVKHTMLKNERLGEWYARTLIGKAQVLTMSKAEITRAVELANARNAEDGFEVQTIRKAEPKKSQIPIHRFLMVPPQ
jgi:hypothetical protein